MVTTMGCVVSVEAQGKRALLRVQTAAGGEFDLELAATTTIGKMRERVCQHFDNADRRLPVVSISSSASKSTSSLSADSTLDDARTLLSYGVASGKPITILVATPRRQLFVADWARGQYDVSSLDQSFLESDNDDAIGDATLDKAAALPPWRLMIDDLLSLHGTHQSMYTASQSLIDKHGGTEAAADLWRSAHHYATQVCGRCESVDAWPFHLFFLV